MRTGFFRIKSTKTKAKAKGNVIKQLLLIVTTLCFLISSTAQASTYYFHNDHLGTPQVLTDENQQVVWQGVYDPFGHAAEVVSEVEQNLRFPGQYLDRETGLHYNWHRTYNPQTGRYTQSDPIGLGGGVNTYGYAYQNPVIYTDPTGEAVPAAVTVFCTINPMACYSAAAATSYAICRLFGSCTIPNGYRNENKSEDQPENCPTEEGQDAEVANSGDWKTPKEWAEHDHDVLRDFLRKENEGFESGRHDQYSGSMEKKLRQLADAADARGYLPEYGQRMREIANTYGKRARGARHKGGRRN